MILRDYQVEGINKLREGLRIHRSGIIVQPCGSGKGTQIAYMVNQAVSRGLHVVFAVHGKILVDDMSARVSKLGIPHGVIMGSRKRERWHHVQICSIDSLARMSHPPKADLVIIDEAHMALSPGWRKALERYPDAKIVGSSATPIRLDGQGLGTKSGGLFDFIVHGPSESDLIRMGHLVGSRVMAPPPPADLGTVKKTAGEFNAKAQATVCDKPRVIGDIVEHWRKHAEQRSGATAVFAVDVAHAAHIAEQFRSSGYDWAYVDAETPDAERAKIWSDLDNRRIRGVVSVGVIAVGWDHPVVDCIIAARKTASLGLWRQMLGRGSRPYPCKDSFLVLDHVGCTHLHHPFGMFEDKINWSLDGDAALPADKPESISTCESCFATFKAGPLTCPYCGHTRIIKGREIEEVKGDLQEVQPILWEPGLVKPQKSEREMIQVYNALREKARTRGWKPAAVGIQFKMIFGFWPPKRWHEDVRTVDVGL